MFYQSFVLHIVYHYNHYYYYIYWRNFLLQTSSSEDEVIAEYEVLPDLMEKRAYLLDPVSNLSLLINTRHKK